ncbi:LAMI_0C10968g1_1 [Lachancea mirantina]|uniref:LAMI_0C10968g1_1 n=1 Tax=Lachancea mirantina TaxID=1230905 RepID=A0A1G4J678_9SACH|nr:LAMI_0C10968g1_1 [Lachancea mirantina]
MYVEKFRNSFAVDLLELAALVKLPHNFQEQQASAKTDDVDGLVAQAKPHGETNLELPGDVVQDVDADTASATGSGSASASVDLEKNDAEKASNQTSDRDVDPFLVGWNGADDPENPMNWSKGKKGLVVLQIMLLTCVTYMGASIYTPGQEQIQHDFHVGHVVGTLNLSMYVLGYGLGPMIFSPLSEVAAIGRQRIYIVTLLAFMIFQVGAATVNNIGGLVVIRFISGILCSPSLATGAASLGDFIPKRKVPVFVGLWAVGAVAAPVLAPLLGATMVVAKGWRFIFWLLMWLCAVTSIILIFFFPETQQENILHRRACRLRKATGDARYYTKQERADSLVTFKDLLLDALYRPFKIMASEPAVLAFDIYIALCYGTFYLFFEAFPLVFVGIYHFTLVEMGLAYMGFCVGCALSYIALLIFLAKVTTPRQKNNTFTPEAFLLLAMYLCWALPLSLFLFGWAAGVHWILPIIAEVFFVLNVFNLFQSSFAYLADSYPRYLASVFAGNGFARAGFACAFPLFGQAMYKNLGSEKYPVGWGSSLVGFFCIALAAIPFVLYRVGPKLRGRSQYAN